MNRAILALVLSPLVAVAAAVARAEPGDTPATKPTATATPDGKGSNTSASTGGGGSVETSSADGDYRLSIKYGPNGSRTLTVKDSKGTELFSGPVDTDEQKKAIPDDLRPLFDKADRQVKVSVSSSTSSESSFSDGKHRVSVKQGPDGSKTLTVKDPKGNELFSGPVDTDEQKKAVPEDLQPLLEKIEKMNAKPPGGPTETKAADPSR